MEKLNGNSVMLVARKIRFWVQSIYVHMSAESGRLPSEPVLQVLFFDLEDPYVCSLHPSWFPPSLIDENTRQKNIV